MEITTIDTPRPTYPFIPDTIPTEEPVSVHLMEGPETVLFGTGYASGAAHLLRRIGRVERIDIVVVEHGHPDHYDAVALLRELNPDLTVAVPAADADALADTGVEPDVHIEDGTAVGGTRAIHVPGHTPGNMSFFHEPTGTLFAGDTVVHADSPNAAPGEWSGALAPMKPELNHDDGAARENIERLSDYATADIRITHGPNVTGGNADAELEALLSDLDG